MTYYPLLTGDELPQAVILAGGDFPRHVLPRKILSAASRVVCCDGAAAPFLATGRVPQAIVGDGDSLAAEIREKYAAIVHREKEQESNDLTKAFRYCLKQGWKKVYILGATGKREDHTLGNISLLSDYRQLADVWMLTDYGFFIPVRGDAEFGSFPGQQVSVFNRGCSRLRGEGLLYPLSVFTNWWQGTLNEALGNTFRLYTDGELLVFRTYRTEENESEVFYEK